MTPTAATSPTATIRRSSLADKDTGIESGAFIEKKKVLLCTSYIACIIYWKQTNSLVANFLVVNLVGFMQSVLAVGRRPAPFLALWPGKD